MSSTGANPNDDEARVAEALEQLRELGGDAFVARIAVSFTRQATEFFSSARADADAGNVANIAAVAHRIRGVGAQLQAEQFCAACLRLEDTARQGDASAVRPLIDDVEAAFAMIRAPLSRVGIE